MTVPFIPRRQLAAWAGTHARPRSSVTEQNEAWLIVLLERHRLALPLYEVDSIIRIPDGGHALPTHMTGALGLIPWRQEVMILWDLAALLGLRTTLRSDPAQRALLLQNGLGGRTALLVDGLIGQEALCHETFQKTGPISDLCPEGVLAITEHAGTTLTLLHLPGLIAAIHAILNHHRQAFQP